MRSGAFSLLIGTVALLSGCTSSLHVSSSNSNPPGKLAFASTALTAATAGAAYNDLITVTGGTTPYIFSATGLPGGLAIDASSGEISGTPPQSAIGTASVT